MNRNDARKIAETITNEQLQQMLETAKAKITDWTKVSNVNKGMTKGAVWNVLAKNFKCDTKYHILAKINMVREFGEFLPNEIKPMANRHVSDKPPFHQDPEF